MSDAELVRQALAGQAEAYAELVRRWSPRVLALCHARVRRADAAEDLAQEALLRGYRALATLSQPDRFGAWGESAGGHLVALLGTTSDVDELEGTVGGNKQFSSSVQAVVDWFGESDRDATQVEQ